MSEEAEELEEFALKEAKSKKAKLTQYIGNIEYNEYAGYATCSKKDLGPSRVNEAFVALELLLGSMTHPSRSRHQFQLSPNDENPRLDSARKVEKETACKITETLETRKLNKQIESNRGLTRVRPKSSGNARVSNRRKYERSLKKLSGRRMKADEVQADGGYSGESRGITLHVNRSRRIT